MSDAVRHVMIRGHVQGVGFRYWATREAIRLGLYGWVRNRRDGAVEAVFAGPADAVAEMMVRCGQGPASARVDGIEELAATPDILKQVRPGERFSQLPTV